MNYDSFINEIANLSDDQTCAIYLNNELESTRVYSTREEAIQAAFKLARSRHDLFQIRILNHVECYNSRNTNMNYFCFFVIYLSPKK